MLVGFPFIHCPIEVIKHNFGMVSLLQSDREKMFIHDGQRVAWFYERYRLSYWFISRSLSAVANAAVSGVNIVPWGLGGCNGAGQVRHDEYSCSERLCLAGKGTTYSTAQTYWSGPPPLEYHVIRNALCLIIPNFIQIDRA
jgi:hypothetical protein